MRLSGTNRVLNLLLALAFLVGLQVSGMPRAMASPELSVKPIAQLTIGDCNGCGQGSIGSSECVGICSPATSLTGEPAPIAIALDGSWIWLNESMPTTGVEPELSPPRS